MTDDRRQAALAFRIEAANTAFNRDHPKHLANGDEERYACEQYAMSFTKGLDHDHDTGLLKERMDYVAYRAAIDTGFIHAFTDKVPVPVKPLLDEDGNQVVENGKPLFEERRQWEAPTAGLVFELEGPDPQAVTMPPAPALGSKELAYEMAEVYELALLRDVPFTLFQTEALKACHERKVHKPALPKPKDGAHQQSVDLSIARLDEIGFDLGGQGSARPRLTNDAGQITAQEAFRGASPGVEVGPYLSQFMLIGSPNGNRPGEVSRVDEGRIAYGSITILQKVAKAAECEDFMIDKKSWLHVQKGFEPRPATDVTYNGTRFISTPRDLATYVHYDALYEAYLNAALILLGMGTPFDPGFANLSGQGGFVSGGTRSNLNPPLNAGGFALYGGPHILNLVTEVSTRALKAVRFQKFNNHSRLRPETLAGRLACQPEIANDASLAKLAHLLNDMVQHLTNNAPKGDTYKNAEGTIPSIEKLNVAQGGDDRPFLPMAFSEGSPMHPAYGAGHATVAGACVTILKAFFDTDAVLVLPDGNKNREAVFKRCEPTDKPVAYVSDYKIGRGDGHELLCVEVEKPLTLEGELNKLAANISIGRNMAGVHYFTDYYDSVRMGEEIAIGILEEQALGYKTDPFVMSVPTFDGDVVRIGRR
ncbi:MAG: vanadium-dependent haloperoxidase [Pseudomonadota bacterium]